MGKRSQLFVEVEVNPDEMSRPLTINWKADQNLRRGDTLSLSVSMYDIVRTLRDAGFVIGKKV